ncbi:MAG: hypothetical protein ACOH2K_07615 [Burkholderiaceae bacterium]
MTQNRRMGETHRLSKVQDGFHSSYRNIGTVERLAQLNAPLA